MMLTNHDTNESRKVVAREMGGTPTTIKGEGTRAVDCTFGEEIYWLEVG